MKDCAHKNIKTATITRQFLNETFKGKAEVCSDCGHELWNDSVEKEYRTWVDGIDQRPKIQFKISEDAELCLKEISKPFPSANQSSMVRALIMAYLTLMDGGPVFNDLINKAFDSDYFQRIEGLSREKLIGTEVKPSFLHDVVTWGNLFDIKPNEMASEAFHVIIALCFSKDRKLQDFWKKEILPRLETYLKIA